MPPERPRSGRPLLAKQRFTEAFSSELSCSVSQTVSLKFDPATELVTPRWRRRPWRRALPGTASRPDSTRWIPTGVSRTTGRPVPCRVNARVGESVDFAGASMLDTIACCGLRCESSVDGSFQASSSEFRFKRTMIVSPTRAAITNVDPRKSQILFRNGKIPACALHIPVAIRTGDQPWVMHAPVSDSEVGGWIRKREEEKSGWVWLTIVTHVKSLTCSPVLC